MGRAGRRWPRQDKPKGQIAKLNEIRRALEYLGKMDHGIDRLISDRSGNLWDNSVWGFWARVEHHVVFDRGCSTGAVALRVGILDDSGLCGNRRDAVDSTLRLTIKTGPEGPGVHGG